MEPLKDAMTEEQWQEYNADIAAKAKSEKQAQEAAEQQHQAAEAQAAAEHAAQQAEAERQEKLTKAWLLHSTERKLLKTLPAAALSTAAIKTVLH